MVENIVPLTVEHLREMCDEVRGLRTDMKFGFDDVRKRLGRVEQSMLGLKRDEIATATELTEHRLSFDRVFQSIDNLNDRVASLEEGGGR